MSATFSLLKHGDRRVLEAYRIANAMWDEILANYQGDLGYLVNALSSKQLQFEWTLKDLGLNRWSAQEVMVFSGLSYYLDCEDDAYRSLAISVAEAFEMSYCSIEVKSLAKRVAAMFYLERGFYG
ncbi:hypothetical protein GWQ29_13960 [Aeromonas sp. 2HA2]|uniref:hypothetical protein n=1 Tax=unclassified Aeromonas TaxID=257493 RepID=UPI0023DD8997|nr:MULTISPECIES: hypothetical protein [unclassified Aeromonas]MDF2392392.1 hypothetical protein [Aeromonas sp. 2MA4]MDF2410518.1 hypothetical protein [Aeromonas sp. 2HA2]